MKKPYLKKQLFFKTSIVFIGIIAALFINSCKKDAIGNQKLDSNDDAHFMEDYQTVNPNEITSWISKNLSSEQQSQLQLLKSKQSVINQHHVVRIPIGKNAALFFTKTEGKMQVYAYKWLNKKPSNKSYTGYIAAYSFESHDAKQFEYTDSKKVKENFLQVRTNSEVQTSTPNLGIGSEPTPQTSSTGEGNLFSTFWCWLTGGQYITKSDIDAGRSAGANGEVGKVGCDYTKEIATIDYDDITGNGGGDFSWSGGSSFISGSPQGAGASPNGGGSTGYGDGTYWVNVWVPSKGCCTNPNVPCTTLCEEAHWETFTTQNPQSIEHLISTLNTSSLTAGEKAYLKNSMNQIALSPTGNKILSALDAYYTAHPTAVKLSVTHIVPDVGTDDYNPNTHTINMGNNFINGNLLSYMTYNLAHEIYHEFENINNQSPLYSNFEADAYMFGVQVIKETPEDVGTESYEKQIEVTPTTTAQTNFNTAWTNFLNGNVSPSNYTNIINNFLTGSKYGPNYTTYYTTINGVRTPHTVTNNPTVMPLFLQ